MKKELTFLRLSGFKRRVHGRGNNRLGSHGILFGIGNDSTDMDNRIDHLATLLNVFSSRYLSASVLGSMKALLDFALE